MIAEALTPILGKELTRKKSMSKYTAKGFINFVYDEEGLNSYIREFSDAELEFDCDKFEIYSLMTGEEFLKDVDTGGYIDYDGTLADVFVDGYKSNLGLFHEGIHQGNFLVSEKIWKMLCEENKIEVNWANK